VNFALDNHKFCGNQAKNIKAYCHPDVYDPVSGILFRSRGDGTFEDVTREAGVYVVDEGKGLGVVWGDYDNDGDVDLYVANDSMRSFLFRNEGRGRFADVTLLSGVGYSEDGKTQAAWEPTWGLRRRRLSRHHQDQPRFGTTRCTVEALSGSSATNPMNRGSPRSP
jgi:hypothetical protein